MNNHNLIIKELGERLKDQPVNMALTKRIIKALMSDTAMPAWRFFPDDTKTVGKVIDCVRQAWEQSLYECRRPAPDIERKDIRDVINKAKSLQKAIKCSSLPGNWVNTDFEIEAAGMPPMPIEIGWHSLRDEGYDSGYPIAIYEVLDWAVEMAEKHLENLPLRMLERKSNNPQITAFVRRLTRHFIRQFSMGGNKDTKYQTAIGHITTAVFNLSDPFDAKDVDVCLRGLKIKFPRTPT